MPHVLALARPRVRLPRGAARTQRGLLRIAQLGKRLARPGSRAWRSHLRALERRGVTLTPAFGSFVVGRDPARMRALEWMGPYAPPPLRRSFAPTPENRSAFYRRWGTDARTAWISFTKWWMRLVRDYRAIGGRVAAASTPGKRYQLHGFSTVAELELLREAGLSRLDALRAATIEAARTLYRRPDPPTGMIAPGKFADLAIVPEDPLPGAGQPDWRVRGGGFKVLYGTGHQRLNRTTLQIERVGGVRWTIKDGRVYDARALLAEVREMAAATR